MEPAVTFFVTTARSGTQWLAQALTENRPDGARIEHEPVGYLYQPRRTLRDPEALRALLVDPRIEGHFASISRTLAEGRSYVEIGFPAFALYPLLKVRFGDALRIVHLVREPVRVAASLTTHGWYVPGRRNDIEESVALTPSDGGVTLTKYADDWPDMPPFEKCLFFWYEVHRYGLELEKAMAPDHFARFRLRDLTTDPGEMARLLHFTGLSVQTDLRQMQDKKVDRYSAKSSERIDWKAIEKYPEILGLAERFGYSLDELDPGALASRYQLSRLRALAGAVKRRLVAAH